MCFFTFSCFAIFFLSFSVGYPIAVIPAFITTVDLTSPATSTDVKNLTTPGALDFPYLCSIYLFDNPSSAIAYNRKK